MSKYDELKKQYEETAAERDRLVKEAEALREQFLAAKQSDVEERIANMSDEEKKYIIAHTEHSRNSCSDEDPCNGLYSATNNGNPGYRCPKCMLMEILRGEHGGKYDFKLHFDIYEVTV